MNTEVLNQRLDLYEDWLNENNCQSPSSSHTIADVSFALRLALQLRPKISTFSHIYRRRSVVTVIAGNSIEGQNVLASSKRRCQILDLPKETFCNIASFMTPPALLNCARSCKAFRAFLLEKSDTVHLLWKNALAAVPHLPSCPEDMTEPRYTALVFDTHCLACGASEASAVDYAMRLRLCYECYKENISEGRGLLEGVPDELGSVAMALLPCQIRIDVERLIITSDVSAVDPVNNDVDDHFYKPAFLSVMDVLRSFSAEIDISIVKEALRLHAQAVLKQQVHGALLLAWDNVARYFGRRHTKATDANYDRRYFMRLLKLSEYLEEDSPLGNIARSAHLEEESIHEEGGTALVKHHEQIIQEWETMKHYKDEARRIRFRRRLEGMHDLYNEMVAFFNLLGCLPHPYMRCPETDLFPNRCDGVLFLREMAGHNSARGEIHIGSLLQEASFVRKEFALYSRIYVIGLNRLINKEKVRVRNKYEALVWPTALFVCTACPEELRRPYAFPAIHVHWRSTHPDMRCLSNMGKLRFVEVWNRAWDIVPKALATAGVPHNQPSIFILDYLLKEGRLYCACGDPTLPLPEDLNWATFVLHMDAHAQAHDAMAASHNGENATSYGTNDLEMLVKYLPSTADTSPAHKRFSSDPVTTLRVWSRLEECPSDMQPTCALCKSSERECCVFPLNALPRSADEIVYHMEARHGRAFEEEYMVFEYAKAL